MTITICCIKKNEIVFPNEFQYWLAEKDSIIYFESSGPITIFNKNKELYANEKNAIFLKSSFKNFRFINKGSTPIKVNGIILKINPNPIENNEYIILNREDTNLKRKMNYISKLFKGKISLERSLLTIEEVILLNSYKTVKKTNRSDVQKIDSRLIKVNRFIRENYNKEISLQILCELIQCNPTYLSNTYSKVFKISPVHYINLLRINKAKEMLNNTTMQISEIARKVGYLSISQFSSIFKRYVYISPKEFRRNNYTIK